VLAPQLMMQLVMMVIQQYQIPLHCCQVQAVEGAGLRGVRLLVHEPGVGEGVPLSTCPLVHLRGNQTDKSR
jgi:hypothetical protein